MIIKKKEFISPFCSDYWYEALKELQNIKMLVLGALMIALRIALGMLIIPVGSNLRVLFKFIPDCIGSAIYGPVEGMIVGLIGDILGYIVFPSGAYFPGYTLSAILTNLVFALFLYRREISWLRVVAARLCANLFINVGLGCLWSNILYGKGYIYYAATSIVKNSILWIPESIVLILLISILLQPMNKGHLIPYQQKLKKFTFKSKS